AAQLKEEAAAVTRQAEGKPPAALADAAVGDPADSTIDQPENRIMSLDSRQPNRPHLALRIDGRPPWSHPLARLYWCPRCGYLTGAQLQASPVQPEIPGPDRWITRADLDPNG
ncbi:MAG TPA: hypothetical protein VN714_05930, partial [Trebonia sp.]|nr:hypothetical protein [Trebonia sp.]